MVKVIESGTKRSKVHKIMTKIFSKMVKKFPGNVQFVAYIRAL